ncbi:MAG: 30S ribosomal protein S21 [Candidatus Pacebacteria bacterium]|jgi:small subunit ribosomal protein S21|nr:30S ribosomal protein S21 [Candidatus Paceibacterota bacterium]
MRVEVRNDNVEQALRIFKKKVLQEGILNELKEREYFRTKGEKRRQSKAAGIRRFKREQQKRKEELGI